MCLPLPLRICFKADLYPRVYLPDLTTSARRAAMDSVDFAAFDFLVGAIVIVGVLGNGNLIAGWMRPIHQFTRYKVCHTAHS